MREVKLVIALLAACVLVLGTGYAFAQQPQPTPTTPSATPPPSTSATSEKLAATAPANEKATTPKMSKGQPKGSRLAKEEKGEKEVAQDRVVRGNVTAVETSASPGTLTMEVKKGKEMETVGVDVPSATQITEGKAKKSLADIKAGDHVWMRYGRLTDRLVAEQIRILPAGSKLTKAGKSKAATVATPAASKSETSKKSS